jgi:hypothetical protein
VSSASERFEKNVFINCPFDEEYRPLLEPLLFTIVSFGYSPRIAIERSDSGESRLGKIVELVKESKYSIHDLSRLKATKAGALQRMNMPFELGVDYGTRVHGSSRMQTKKFLILEKDRYEFQKAISDISGFDIKAHGGDPARIIRVVREWFVETVGLRGLEGPSPLWYRFTDFTTDFWRKRLAEGFTHDEVNSMPIPEYLNFLDTWISEKI